MGYADGATTRQMTGGLCGCCVTVDGEELLVEDTVAHAVVEGRLSADLLDHGCDTYWCVTASGHHRLVRASEILVTG
ncbi:MAG: hypothetical protein ACLGI8_06995 [Acidimicrobiia bacterium]|jgi:hypothetical protein